MDYYKDKLEILLKGLMILILLEIGRASCRERVLRLV